jgi:hypothetical protein
MNERIRELMQQAGTDTSGKWMGVDHAEKFAELIVRECATAFEAEVNTWKEMDPYQGSIKRQGTKAIKKHFGVEE